MALPAYGGRQDRSGIYLEAGLEAAIAQSESAPAPVVVEFVQPLRS